jgi:hypothetical protein
VHGNVTDAPRIDDRDATCFGERPGRLRPYTDVGPDPVPAHGFDEAIVREVATLQHAGYRTRPPARRSLRPRASATETIELAAGRCLAVSALGGPNTSDLDLIVRNPDGSLRVRDAARARDARVAVCAETAARLEVEARMYDGEGEWALVVGEMPRPQDPPAGLEGDAVAGLVAVTQVLRDRGFEVGEGRWVALGAGESIALPLPARHGAGCFAVAAVPAEETLGGRVDLRLLDSRGRAIAVDLGRSERPIVYACAEPGDAFEMEASLYGAAGRIWLMTTRFAP